MSESDEIISWLERLARGENLAAIELWNKYFQQLQNYARQRMNGAARRAYDEEDMALSALNSFCTGQRQGRFPDLADENGLWRLLLTITARKVAERGRESSRIKRGGGAVRGESVFEPNDDAAEGYGGIADVASDDWGPVAIQGLRENTERLLACLDPDLREIALWRLEGYSCDEIAGKLRCVRRTVERKLERIRHEWKCIGYAP